MDAKEFLEHADRVVFIRRMPAWISTEDLGRQVVCLSVDRRQFDVLVIYLYSASIMLTDTLASGRF